MNILTNREIENASENIIDELEAIKEKRIEDYELDKDIKDFIITRHSDGTIQIHLVPYWLIDTMRTVTYQTVLKSFIFFEIRQVYHHLLEKGVIFDFPLPKPDLYEIQNTLSEKLFIDKKQVTEKDDIVCVEFKNKRYGRLFYMMDIFGYYNSNIEKKDGKTFYYFKRNT